MKQRFWVWATVLLVAVGALAACASSGGPAGEARLEGTVWQLASYADGQGQTVTALADSKVTAEFQDGQVGGSAGCNQYGGEYKHSGKRLTVGMLAMTEMYCQSEALMDQEQAYLAALGSAASFQIAAGRLEVSNGEGEVVLTFGPLAA